MKPRIAFVLEQGLGHTAYGMSLRGAIKDRTDFEPLWLEVSREGRQPRSGNGFLRTNLRARSAIAGAARQGALHALFVHTESISLLSADYVSRVPTILSFDATPRNFDSLARWYGHPVGNPVAERAKLAIHRQVIGLARGITTWSEWARRSVIDDYGATPSIATVIPPGTRLSAFQRPSRGPTGTEERPKFLFVGGDFMRKGGDLLVSVFRKYFENRCELHIATDAKVPTSRNVHVYTGVKPQSPELFRLFQEADVFALPTRADCFGIVIAEAMAAGLPVVTTRVAAIPEAVTDGENGFVIEVDDEEALRERLERLASSVQLRLKMGAAARRLAEERFDDKKNADRLVDLLLRVGR